MFKLLSLLAAAGVALAAPYPQAPQAPASNYTGGNGGKVAFAGINIAGFDFGCTTQGSCSGGIVNIAQGDGIAQMSHFVSNSGMNAFRLPVGWQYLVNNNLGGPLDGANAGNYDALVKGCVSSGAKMCIIDIHNYARWNGAIIGQGGPTNEQFASVWSQLAAKYKDTPQVVFDIMNEPHDLDIGAWAGSAQAAVNAIRQAGAQQMILLPGTQYTSAAAFPSQSGPALMGVKNPDGSYNNLVFNVHQYLDADFSGTNANCVTNNIANAFQPLANYLRSNNRQAMVTETGGGPTDASCLANFCQQNAFINQNADVFKGVIGWGAGGFSPGYTISMTPNGAAGSFSDQPIVQQCMTGMFKGM